MDFQPIFDYLSSYNIDVIVPLLIVCFLLIVPWGTDVWQNVFTVLFFIKGLIILLFPQQAAEFLILKKIDALHLQELRCLGIILITDALVHVLTRRSSDPTVKTSLLWSRTVFFATYAMLTYFSIWNAAESKKNNLNLQRLQISLSATVLFLGGFLYYSLTQPEWGGYSEQTKTRRDVHIKIDFLIWFCHGMLSFVYPKIACQFQTNLTELDTAHGLLARAMGAGFLARAVMAGRSANFLREEDKKSTLLTHAIANILFLMTMAFCQIFTRVFSEWHLYYGMSFVAATMINALLGCDVPSMVRSLKIELRTGLTTFKED